MSYTFVWKQVWVPAIETVAVKGEAVANQEQLEILKQGVEIWNEWREDNPTVKIDLSGANLMHSYLVAANLIHANLTGADLMEANLEEANLTYANLMGADLVGANLKEADLWGVSLEAADLMEANLSEAVLSEANLSGANLIRADFRFATLEVVRLKEANLAGSYMGHTLLVNTDLSVSIGLEAVRHTSPSKICTNTLQRSKGKMPVEFLRGCGLSDLEIEFAKLAAPGLDPDQVTQVIYEIQRIYCDQPIKYYDCFISYNNQDQSFVKRLHDNLQNRGVRCWFAPEDMKIGDQIRSRIDREIRLRDKLLVILSENSIKSEWVGDEVEAALEEENKSGRLILCPIRLDDAVMNTRDDWPAKIKRRRHIGDFSNWQDEGSYRRGFERLLRDLKAQ